MANLREVTEQQICAANSSIKLAISNQQSAISNQQSVISKKGNGARAKRAREKGKRKKEEGRRPASFSFRLPVFRGLPPAPASCACLLPSTFCLQTCLGFQFPVYGRLLTLLMPENLMRKAR